MSAGAPKVLEILDCSAATNRFLSCVIIFCAELHREWLLRGAAARCRASREHILTPAIAGWLVWDNEIFRSEDV